jgi:hypothetical protein
VGGYEWLTPSTYLFLSVGSSRAVLLSPSQPTRAKYRAHPRARLLSSCPSSVCSALRHSAHLCGPVRHKSLFLGTTPPLPPPTPLHRPRRSPPRRARHPPPASLHPTAVLPRRADPLRVCARRHSDRVIAAAASSCNSCSCAAEPRSQPAPPRLFPDRTRARYDAATRHARHAPRLPASHAHAAAASRSQQVSPRSMKSILLRDACRSTATRPIGCAMTTGASYPIG